MDSQLRQAALERIEQSFELLTSELPIAKPATPQDVLLSEINLKLDRLTWLGEGADSYDVVDQTILATKEADFDYGPFLMWAVSVVNAESSGGNNLLLRFTDTTGRVKQHRIRAASTLDLDLKGTMGSSFKLIAREGTVETIVLILLKWPFQAVRPLNI